MPRRRKDTNGEADDGVGYNSGTIDSTALKEYVVRAARIMDEQHRLGEDLKEVCNEADEAGVATKREVRRLARESLMDHDVLRQQLDRMDMLRAALGGFATTPLGEAALDAMTGRR